MDHQYEREDEPSVRKVQKSKRDSLSKRLSTGRPGSRRHRRWLNQTFLESLRGDIDPTDDDASVGDPVYPQSDGRTPLAQLFEEGNSDVWDKFLTLSEEEQQRLLFNLMSVSSDSNGDGDGDSDNDNDNERESEKTFSQQEMDFLISRAFFELKPRQAKLLKNSDFLNELEKEILHYLDLSSEAQAKATKVAEELFSSTQFFDSFVHLQPPRLEVFFHDPFHRLLAHGLCRFYSLESSSADSFDSRVTVINKASDFCSSSLPPFCVGDYLNKRGGGGGGRAQACA